MQLVNAAITGLSGSEAAANTTTASGQVFPAIAALTGGGYVVTWTDDTFNISHDTVVRFRVFDANGIETVAETAPDVSSGYALDGAKVAGLSNGNFLETWRVQPNGGNSDPYIQGQIYTAAGTAVGSVFTVYDGAATDAVATGLASGTAVMAYTDWYSDQVRFKLVDAGGNLGSAVGVSTAGHVVGDAALATLHDGRFVVAWDDGSGASETIKAAIYNANGTLSVSQFTVNTTPTGQQHTPQVSVLEDGRILFGWTTSAYGADAHKNGAYTQIFDPRTSAVSITGSNTLADQLVGTSHNDTFRGQGGRDLLAGRLGNDKLTGGADNDFFVFDSKLNKSTNVDHITDFSHGHDKIELSHSIFTHIGTKGTLASKYFTAHASASNSNQHLLYDKAHGKLYFDSDGKSHSHSPVLFAVIDGHHTLSASDFTIV